MNMRTKAFLLMSLLLLSLICLSSCSNDDDDNNAGKSEIIGTWYLVGASDGWGGYKEYKEGEITITFTPNGDMLIKNKRKDQQPIPTGTRQYNFADIEKSIYSGKPRHGISWGFLTYGYVFKDGILELEAEAYDAPGYTLKYCRPIKKYDYI